MSGDRALGRHPPGQLSSPSLSRAPIRDETARSLATDCRARTRVSTTPRTTSTSGADGLPADREPCVYTTRQAAVGTVPAIETVAAAGAAPAVADAPALSGPPGTAPELAPRAARPPPTPPSVAAVAGIACADPVATISTPSASTELPLPVRLLR